MARHFVAALALAHGTVALLDRKINNHAVANVVAAAATTTNPGLLACVTADAITSACFGAASANPKMPVASIQDCLCCYSGVELDPLYSDCASYIYLTESTATNAFSIVTSLYDICSLAGTCNAVGGGGRTLPSIPTTSTTSRTAPPVNKPTPTAPSPKITAPADCASLAYVYSACYTAMTGFTSAPVSKVASCFCYDNTGSYNTDIQGYADGCEPWAKTADTSDYPLITLLQTLCDVYAAPTIAGGSVLTSRLALTLKPTHHSSSSRSGDDNGGAGQFGSFAGFGGSSGNSIASTSTQDRGGGATPTSDVTVTQTPGPRPGSNSGNKGVDIPGEAVIWILGVVGVVFVWMG